MNKNDYKIGSVNILNKCVIIITYFLLVNSQCYSQKYDDDLHDKCVENREYCLKLAKSGNSVAQNAYGIILELRDENYEQALIWYQKAATKKNGVACHNLACLYFYGKGVKENNYEAIKWNTLAIKYGNSGPEVWLQLGDANYLSPINNYKRALECYQKAATENDATAQYKVGLCHEKGQGVEANSIEAFKWYKKAAEGRRGTFQAKYTVGLCYYNGNGTERNYKEAVKWFYELANINNSMKNLDFANEDCTKGQFALGICYFYGQGVTKDLDSAKSYIQKAANNGHEKAIEFLNNNESSFPKKPDNSAKKNELLAELEIAQSKYDEVFKKLQNMSTNPYYINMDINLLTSILLKAQQDCYYWLQQVNDIKFKLRELGYKIY